MVIQLDSRSARLLLSKLDSEKHRVEDIFTLSYLEEYFIIFC